MELLGLVLFFWILGGIGLMAAWADRIMRDDRSAILFRPVPVRRVIDNPQLR